MSVRGRTLLQAHAGSEVQDPSQKTRLMSGVTRVLWAMSFIACGSLESHGVAGVRPEPSSDAKAKATSLWQEHASFVNTAVARRGSDDEILRAIEYFERVCEMEIGIECGTLGCFPLMRSPADLGGIRACRGSRGARLFSPREVAAAKTSVQEWDRHESVLVRSSDPRMPVEEFFAAREFFSRLTRLPTLHFEVEKSSKHAAASAETAHDLERLEQWFEQHKDRLYWDAKAQEVRVYWPTETWR